MFRVSLPEAQDCLNFRNSAELLGTAAEVEVVETSMEERADSRVEDGAVLGAITACCRG